VFSRKIILITESRVADSDHIGSGINDFVDPDRRVKKKKKMKQCTS
jgi:hypothetical protein